VGRGSKVHRIELKTLSHTINYIMIRNQNVHEVMVDIETLGTRPYTIILVIGAVKFSRTDSLSSSSKKSKEPDTFYRRIDIQSCKDVGMNSIDRDTIEWWKKQPEHIRYEAVKNPDRVPLQQALREFAEWIQPCELIWSNGRDFDCSILEEAFHRCHLPIPWKFWNTRDVRTILDLGNVRKRDLPDNDQHHALHDCHRQIVGVKLALKNLGL